MRIHKYIYIYIYICMNIRQNMEVKHTDRLLCMYVCSKYIYIVHTYRHTYMHICSARPKWCRHTLSWAHGAAKCSITYMHAYIHTYIRAELGPNDVAIHYREPIATRWAYEIESKQPETIQYLYVVSVHVYMHICMYMRKCVCLYVCMYIYIYMIWWTHTHIYTYTYTYTHTHTHMHIWTDK